MSEYLELGGHIETARRTAKSILDGLRGGQRASQIMDVLKHLHAARNAITDPPKAASKVTDVQIKYMVNRFLGWRLPKPWNPDNGISYQRPNYAHPPADHDWPTGTNLFGAAEADAMVRHMLDGMP